MSTIRGYAEQLSDVYLRMEDCKADAAAIIEAAKDAVEQLDMLGAAQ